MASVKFPRHAVEHLKASGLTAQDFKRLALTWLRSEEVAERLSWAEPASFGGILFPYFEPDGTIARGTCRIRLLPNPQDGYVELKAKYLQPPGTPPRAYLPPLVDWKALQGNNVPLLITEGEKKAAAACKAGFPCVGLGGVWSFSQKDIGVDFLPDLEAIRWERRVVIAYDSDWRENKEVRKAVGRLARTLGERGADVYALILEPDSEGRKVGLDDFLVAYGSAALQDALDGAVSLTPEFAALQEYRQRFVLVRTLSCAWDRETSTLFTRPRLRDAFPEDRIMVSGPTGRPQLRFKTDLWWEDQRKISANKQVLRPGEPLITESGDLNLFLGWGREPQEADTSIWEELLDIVFQSDRKSIDWFERWLAYPLQFPGTKLHQAVFVYGAGQGTGKTAIGNFMLDIYGKSGRQVGDREIFGSFNGWLGSTLFALGDDLCFDDRRKSRSALKVLIDAETIEVNEKFVPSYRLENRCNFYLTSNAPGALPVDPSGLNRRFLVIAAPEERTKPKEWYTKTLDTWRNKQGGAAAVYARLLQLPLKGFKPHEDAPDTAAKTIVVESGRSTVETWISEQLLAQCAYELATAQELYGLYQATTDDRRTGPGAFNNSLSSIARRLGQHRDGDKIIQLWALRNKAQWQEARPRDRIAQYRKERSYA